LAWMECRARKATRVIRDHLDPTDRWVKRVRLANWDPREKLATQEVQDCQECRVKRVYLVFRGNQVSLESLVTADLPAPKDDKDHLE